MERARKVLNLGGRKLDLDEAEFQRLQSLAALEHLTPEAWVQRHWDRKPPVPRLAYAGGRQTRQGV